MKRGLAPFVSLYSRLRTSIPSTPRWLWRAGVTNGFLLSMLLLSGCKIGPNYKRPTVRVPGKYAAKQANTAANLAEWWTFFDDPYLNKLIDKAITNNYDLKIACEKIQEARAYFRIQEANLYPEIDAIGTITRTGYSRQLASSSPTSGQTLSYYQVGFDATWELDFWGKLRRAKTAAYNMYEAQIESMRDIYIILLSDVAKAYIDTRALQKKIDLIDQQIALDTDLLSLTHDRFYSGVDSKIPDVDQQAALDESKNQRLSLLIEFKQTVNGLAILLGQNPEEFIFEQDTAHPSRRFAPQGERLVRNTKKYRVPVSKKTLEIGLPSDLLRRRPDIRQAERLLASSTESVGQAIAQWFPSFSLLGSVTPESNKFSTLFGHGSTTWSFGPSVTWPIITFGRIKFNIAEKKSIQKQALLTYTKSVLYALKDVENWLISYFDTQKQVHILKDKLYAGKEKSALVKSLFKSGLDNQLDFLLAEKNRITIELELTDTQQAHSTALISVYKSLGGGW